MIPTISNLILKDPDLDLVVALSVADTYLSCTALNVGIDKERLKNGVGSSIKKLRELGVSEAFLVSGELSHEASLLRAAKIAEIKEFFDMVPFDILATGPLIPLGADPIRTLLRMRTPQLTIRIYFWKVNEQCMQ
jgi:hypothetical protein